MIVAADPKKPEKLAKAKAQDLEQHDETVLFKKITMAIDKADLELWAKEIISEKVKMVKKELEEKKQKKKESFWGSMFGGGGKKDEKEKEQSQFLEEMENDAAELVSEWTSIQGNVKERKQIPNIVVRFAMKELKLTFINNVDDYNGLMLYSRQIAVNLCLFDSSNKYNKRSMELEFNNESYGVFCVEKNQETRRIESSPFMQQLTNDDDDSRKAAVKRVGKALSLHVG